MHEISIIFNNIYIKQVKNMDYKNTHSEKMEFAAYFKGIPSGNRFRIIISLCLITDESYGKWQKIIKKLLDGDYSVDIRMHEVIAIRQLIGEEYSLRTYYHALCAIKD